MTTGTEDTALTSASHTAVAVRWQDYESANGYLFNVSLFHGYVPGTPCHIFVGEKPAVVRSFKHWEGILSYCVAAGRNSGTKNNHASLTVFCTSFDPVEVNVWDDISPTVMCEPLWEAIAFHKSLFRGAA